MQVFAVIEECWATLNPVKITGVWLASTFERALAIAEERLTEVRKVGRRTVAEVPFNKLHPAVFLRRWEMDIVGELSPDGNVSSADGEVHYGQLYITREVFD